MHCIALKKYKTSPISDPAVWTCSDTQLANIDMYCNVLQCVFKESMYNPTRVTTYSDPKTLVVYGKAEKDYSSNFHNNFLNHSGVAKMWNRDFRMSTL
jgi:hypothetical protein